MSLRKAISPVIAIVIILAVTLAITIASLGWVMGLWGTVAGGAEYLQILPDSYIGSDRAFPFKPFGGSSRVVLHVANRGSAAAVIYRVEVVGLGTVEEELTIQPGSETTIDVEIPEECVAGTHYLVTIYTKSGKVYRVHLLCKAAEGWGWDDIERVD